MKKVIGFLLILTVLFNLSFIVCAVSEKGNLNGKPEIVDKRSVNSKHYLNPDGSITAAIHQIPIHYKKNGKWTDINPKLIAKKGIDYDYAMTENNFHLYFSKVSSKPQKFEIGDAWISFQPLDGHPIQGEFNENRVVYRGVWQNTDLEYISNNLGLKENIILNSSEHPDQFSFKVNLHGLSYEQIEDGSILFKDSEDNIQVVIPRANMEDANGEYTEQVEMKIEEQGNHFILTLIPDQEWLNAEERVYPIKVDPTYIDFYYLSISKDAYITQYGLTSKHGLETHLELGMNKPWFSNWVSQWSLIQFDLSTIPPDAVIEHAIATLYLYSEKGGSSVDISVREVLRGWAESTISWDNKPSYSSSFSNPTRIDGVGYYDFALDPSWVQKWVSGTGPNNGFYLTCPYELVSSLKYFYSREKGYQDKSPTLFVKYEGGAGIKNYWSYKSFNLGPAGIASANIFSGNLVLQDVDISVPAKGFNLEFARTYNSNKSAQTGVLGYGWTFSGNSCIIIFDGGNIVRLIGADGSEHLFRKEGTEYKAPEGIDLSLTYDSTKGEYSFKSPARVKYIYSANTKKILRKEDRYGNKINYGYDVYGRLDKISDSSIPARTIQIFYSNDRIWKVIDPKNRSAYYNYDSYGNLESYQDFGGHITHYNFNSSHLLSGVTDPEGNNTHFGYFGEDVYTVRTADQLDGWRETIFATMTSDGIDNLVRVVTEVNGCDIIYTMNREGLVMKKEIEGEDALDTTTYNFAYKDKRIQIVDDTKTMTYYEYDDNTDDGIPNLTKVIRDYGEGKNNYTTIYGYDSYHNVISIKNARGFTITNAWSADGNKLDNVTDAEGNVISYTFYPDGQLETVTVSPKIGENVITEYYYDEYGYPDIIKQPLNSTQIAVIDFDYDIMGNVKVVTDAEGIKTEYLYKPNEDLLEYISNPEYPDDSSKWMKYDYDANHNLRFITYTNQAGRYSIEYFYSPLNQVEEIHYPDGTSEIYKYDDFRRLEQITYGNGDWVKYNYTLKNQLESLEYSDGETVSYTYDKFGNRETMTDKRGVITYIYDDLHRLYQEILPNIEPNIESDYTQYDYDEVDNLVSITMSDGNKLSYEYNKVNKLKKVTDTYSGGNTIYSYDRIYNVTDVTYPDGTIEHYDYDKANRVIEVSYGNVVLPTYNYIYYKNGNLLEKYTDDNSIYYYYDAMNQLTRVRQYGRKVVGPAIFYGNDPTKKKEEEFDYDPMGNRILWKDNGVETTYTYDANNKLTNLQKNAFGQITPTSFSYDDRGNMTSKGSTTYQYNAQGLLKSINKDGNNYVFGYDGDGRRYQQKINHKTIDYLYDKNWNLLSTTGTGPFGLGIKGYINGLKTIGVQEDGGVNYNYHDHQGSTVGVKSGSSVQSYDYSPFGIDSVVVDDFSYVDSPLNHGWQVYTSSDYSGILSTVFDDTLQNQVMRIQSSHGTNFGIAYGYPTNNLNVKRTDLSVKYRADEGIVLFVRVLGENGSQYYLTYRIGYDGSPSVSGMYYNIYLGSSTKDGAWRVLERDLNEDLKEGYGIELDKVLWFCIRGGDYDLDDVKLGGQDLTGNTRKYTDEDQDGTGLYYLRNRYYDPELGRFITADSYRGSITDPLSLNRYIYVKNNPLKYIDPSGHMAQITGGTSSKAEGYNYGDINFVIIGDNVVVCDVKKNSVHINLEEGDARKLGVNLIGAGLMAKAVKVEYRNLIGEDLDIKTGSIAIEIWGHVAAHEVADFMTPVYKKGADKIKNRTRIIDIGTSAVDNNRFLWDALYYAPLL